MLPLIESTTLRAWLGDGAEIALIDVRDGGPFSRSHLLLASNIPLAQLGSGYLPCCHDVMCGWS